jgi:hypothetical protein
MKDYKTTPLQRENSLRYYHNNRQNILEKSKERYNNNREKRIKYAREWQKKNHEKVL